MRFHVHWLAVPILGLFSCLMGSDTHGQAPGQVPVTDVYFSSADEAATMARSVSPCDSGECSLEDGAVLGGLGWGSLAGLRDGSGQVFVGMDWLHVRANFSESVGYIDRDIANFTDTFHEIDMEYNDSYSLYGGYRSCDCCGEIRFGFTRYRSEACLISPTATQNRQIIAPLNVIAVVPGAAVSSCIEVDARAYDIDFARIIPLGSPFEDCSCCWCPAWDLKWFAGLRYADVAWKHAHGSFNAETQLMRIGETRMNFEGTGARIGMEGRRYIGRSGRFSLFAKGAVSLLLGDVEYISTQYDVQTPAVTPTQRASFQRVIPVMDVELGGAIHIRDNITVAGGYLLSSWHDLGIGDQTDYGLQIEYDDANILGFDGFFVRAEVAY